MKTVSVILMLLLLVAAPRASAQDFAAAVPSQVVQPRPVQAPPPPPPPPVRSGSMIGYIDDAIVGTKVRIRFDAGMHIQAPDRAEFFYAKCGCYRDLVGPAFDPNAPGPRPDIATDLNFQQFYVQAEYAVNPRVSVFGELPLRWLQPQEFAGGAAGFPARRDSATSRPARSSRFHRPTRRSPLCKCSSSSRRATRRRVSEPITRASSRHS